MEKEQRNKLQKATQDARRLLEEEFRSQLLQTYDIDVEKERWAEEPGAHLQAEQRLIREKLVAWIEHKEAQINARKEALLLALREMAFTALNRFVALKLMEARELVRPCVSSGLESEGFIEFTAVAQGLLANQESSYRLYLETIFEDLSRELRALFDPRDPASMLWPKRTALLNLLEIVNNPELKDLWIEDETLGWVYQYFNGDAERKKMREESSAPRNSRELAVRNQFFTPRYVVEFLTDNTIGRIWYEMRQGNTELKDRCRYLAREPNEVWLQQGDEPPTQQDADERLNQEELPHQLVYISYRPLKDPREIRMLDPACGSMHFGLYAFDLYLAIYAEAWEIAQGLEDQTKQEEAFSTFATYAAGFADKAAFLREVPRLILQHNIHGIDIDVRATQIARLSLWLRAQRDWHEKQIEPKDRPAICRSNVVCAEPIPGSLDLINEFAEESFDVNEQGIIKQLLRTIFEQMKLAGLAGSLLRIEDEISDAIAQANEAWEKISNYQINLFDNENILSQRSPGSYSKQDLQGITDDFWIDIEEKIYMALHSYAKKAEANGLLEKRLFSQDALQGFAFIDVCKKRYDTVLMNPPFGLMSQGAYDYAVSRYPDSYSDFGIAFIARGLCLANDQGLNASITSRSYFTVKEAQKFRTQIAIPKAEVIVDLGLNVMDDAWVDSSAQILNNGATTSNILFVRSRDNILTPQSFKYSDNCITRGRSYFKNIPQSRLSYNAKGGLEKLLSTDSSGLEASGICLSRAGTTTFDDDRFRRLWWEVDPAKIGPLKTWCFLSKSCEFNLFYYPYHNVFKWTGNGDEIAERNKQVNGQTAQARQGSKFYFRPGLSFSRRGEPTIAFRTYPSACAFSSNGPVVLPANLNDAEYLLGLLNSSWVRASISTQSHKFSYTVGHPKAIKWLSPSYSQREVIANSSRIIVTHKQRNFELDETSNNFIAPFRKHDSDFFLWFSEFNIERDRIAIEMEECMQEIDNQVADLYGLDKNDIEWPIYKTSLRDVQDPKGTPFFSVSDFAASCVSYFIGCAFGRWDIRLLSESSSSEMELDPFTDLLPSPPGLLKNNDGLPIKSTEIDQSSYPITIKWSGILPSEKTANSTLQLAIQEAIKSLGPKGINIAEYFDLVQEKMVAALGVEKLEDYLHSPSGFFCDHLKKYTKSRRQAPIYWCLSAGNCNYSIWLYSHRISDDTLFLVLRDFVEPRIQQAERESCEIESQSVLSDEETRRLHEIKDILNDCLLIKSELDLVAPLWNPNLNDGVIINHAILWRITPYTPWQKKCKECWDKLVKGDYDWGHLAFHLWPERVIPKCTSDRSLAIAHGLEDRLWQETSNDNWLPRQLSEADLQALIAEHSNPAVKSALEKFLAAPPPVAPAKKRTKRSSSASPRTSRSSASTPADPEIIRQVLFTLTAAPDEGLSKNAIAELQGVEPTALTAVIKQLKTAQQIEQLGAARGAKYKLTDAGRAAVAAENEGDA